MQQEYQGQKRPITEDERLKMVFAASREREISKALAIESGKVSSGEPGIQDTLTTCAGEK